MLDYQSQNRLPRYEPTDADRHWFVRRFLYYVGQWILFASIIYRAGPNLFLFGSLFSPAPGDYVALTNDYVPVIAAIKAYQRDFGTLPSSSFELPDDYKPEDIKGQGGEILGYTSITFPVGRNVLEYEFNSASEGWIIHSPRYHGPIPAPIVAAAPPRKRPATEKTNATE